MSERIQARAIRRAGELLKEFDGRGGDRSKSGDAPTSAPSRRDAATSAGMSKDQQVTAVRVANVPRETPKQSNAARAAKASPGVAWRPTPLVLWCLPERGRDAATTAPRRLLLPQEVIAVFNSFLKQVFQLLDPRLVMIAEDGLLVRPIYQELDFRFNFSGRRHKAQLGTCCRFLFLIRHGFLHREKASPSPCHAIPYHAITAAKTRRVCAIRLCRPGLHGGERSAPSRAG